MIIKKVLSSKDLNSYDLLKFMKYAIDEEILQATSLSEITMNKLAEFDIPYFFLEFLKYAMEKEILQPTDPNLYEITMKKLAEFSLRYHTQAISEYAIKKGILQAY